MKAVWNQSVVLPAYLAEDKPKKKVNVYHLLGRVNTLFGLETKGDKLWFYGFYGVSFTILLFIIIVSQAMDLIIK